jgi:hypothetical protein
MSNHPLYYTIRHEVGHVIAYRVLMNITPINMKIKSTGEGIVIVDREHNMIKFYKDVSNISDEYLEHYATNALVGPMSDDPTYYKAWINAINTEIITQENCSDYANLMSVVHLTNIKAGAVEVNMDSLQDAQIGPKDLATYGYSLDFKVVDVELANLIMQRVWIVAQNNAKNFVDKYNTQINQMTANIIKAFAGNRAKSFSLNSKQIDFHLRKVCL